MKMYIQVKKNKKQKVARLSLLISVVELFFLICITAYASAEVFISDHFDNQADWVGYSDGHCVDPPSPWSSYGCFCSDRIHIDSTDDAHGSGKCMWIEWSQAMNELALMTFAAEGKNDFWAGFWWRHNSVWDWGGDATHKWVYLPATNSNNRQMINYDGVNHRTIPPPDDHTYKSNVSFDTSDDSWHYVIYYLKHSTGSGQNDGQLRLWWDGTEVTWSERYTGEPWDNLHIDYGTGSTWTSFIAFGFQSRPDWGPGNKSYFDDIIVASTREEVEDFLGVDSFLLGDLNNDRKINIQDVQLCINVILVTETNAEIVARADVDENGQINVLDVQAIANIILTQ